MKNLLFIFGILMVVAGSITITQAQREDAIWARTVPAGSITLDGNLNEGVWAQAETMNVIYGLNTGLPTSGWRPEFQANQITDSTRATVKFLIEGNTLYMGFYIPDSSIGGTQDWARWDAILMSVKDRTVADRPVAAAEYFYTYWLAGLSNTTPVVGAKPRFIGKFGNFNDTTRTPEQIAAWDAVTIINGTSNDAGRDQSWTVEMKVELGVVGYDVTKPEGDVVLVNFSIWDCDFLFEGNPEKINTTRTHWQSPWGNANGNNVGRIYARPDVTNLTTNLPSLEADVKVPNGANFTAPIIDGLLDETIWASAYTFDIIYGDSLNRSTYPGAGAFMSGQYQPELSGNPRPPVLDPGFATIKMIYKDQYLYVAADVNDQLVQGTEVFDKFDGIGLIVGDRGVLNPDYQLEFRYLRVGFASDASFTGYDYTPVLVDTAGIVFAHTLKGATTVNNKTDVDEGYKVELRIDLTKLGYPTDLGDRALFMGALVLDGDSFDDSLNDYGTRAWWFREHSGGPAAAWMFLDPTLVDVQEDVNSLLPSSVELYGNYPNPFNPETKISFAVPNSGNATVSVFNSLGQEIYSGESVSVNAGRNSIAFKGNNFASGIYLYRINFTDSRTGAVTTSNSGKMIVLK